MKRKSKKTQMADYVLMQENYHASIDAMSDNEYNESRDID